jgi:hypothetical protein
VLPRAGLIAFAGLLLAASCGENARDVDDLATDASPVPAGTGGWVHIRAVDQAELAVRADVAVYGSAVGWPVCGETDDSGCTSLPAEAGRATITARAAGYRAAQTTMVVTETATVELRLLDLSRIGVRGWAVDPQGRPAAGACLSIVEGECCASVGRVGEDGGFVATGIEPGERLVVLSSDSLWPVARPVVVPADGIADLGEIALRAGGVLHGEVRDRDGRPVEASVSLECVLLPGQASRSVLCDAHGYFEASDVQGTVKLIAAARGFVSVATEVLVPPEGRARVEVKLRALPDAEKMDQPEADPGHEESDLEAKGESF